MLPKIIITTLKSEIDIINYLTNKLPEALFCYDKKKCAMDPFLRALDMANNEPCLILEDDIILAKNFKNKALDVINLKSDVVIQFFSMRKADLTVGSRFDYGRNYCMAQCTYFPQNYTSKIIKHFDTWDGKKIHPTGKDLLVADFLKSRKEKYWISCPSLVQHRQAVARIDKRRSMYRQSKPFEGIK